MLSSMIPSFPTGARSGFVRQPDGKVALYRRAAKQRPAIIRRGAQRFFIGSSVTQTARNRRAAGLKDSNQDLPGGRCRR